MTNNYSEPLEVVSSSLQSPEKLPLLRRPGSEGIPGGIQPQSFPKVVVLQVIQPPPPSMTEFLASDYFLDAASAVMATIIMTSLCVVPSLIVAVLMVRAAL